MYSSEKIMDCFRNINLKLGFYFCIAKFDRKLDAANNTIMMYAFRVTQQNIIIIQQNIII